MAGTQSGSHVGVGPWLQRSGLLAGSRAAIPLALPALPIGLLIGVAIRESVVISNLAGWTSSFMIFAGAAQFAAVELIDGGAGVWAVVAAVFMINARHLMYGAAICGRFSRAPVWFRFVGGYLLIDQVFALNVNLVPPSSAGADLDDELGYRMSHYVGTAIPMLGVWVVGAAAGLALGDVIPASWEVDFAIPLMFLGLMVMSLFNVPSIVAAVIGGTVAVVGRDWPNGLGLLAGAVLGVAVAGLLDQALIGRDVDVRPPSEEVGP